MARSPIRPPPLHRVATLECTLPDGVQPGDQIGWVSPKTGQRVLLTVPPAAKAGDKLRFEVPDSMVTGEGAPAAAPATLEP